MEHRRRLLAALGALAIVAGPVGALHAAAQGAHSTGTIVLYAAVGYDQDVATLFQKQTGIQVKLSDMSTGPLVAKVTAERNNPQWDVAWFDGSVTMVSLDQQGYLTHYMSPSVKNYNALGKPLVPGNHAYYPTGVTAAGAIAYNTKLIGNTPLPHSWSDLTKPIYKDQMAENDPAFSGPAFPFIAGIMQDFGGIPAGERYFSALKANGDKIYQTNDFTIKSVETGARKFAIVQDSAVYGEKAAGQPLGIIYPKPGATTLPSVIGIDKNAPHLKLAERFVNWLLTRAGGQHAMVTHDLKDGDSYFKPVIKGVVGHRHDPVGIRFIHLRETFYATRANMIKSWFHNHIVS